MLAISELARSNQAFSINLDGGFVKLDFNFNENTAVYGPCSINFKGMMYIFEDRRVSQVSPTEGCGIKRISDLPFDFRLGSCTVIKEEVILLCFSQIKNEGRVCRIDQNPKGTFDKIKSESNHYHYQSRIASYEGKSGPYSLVIQLLNR